MPTKIPNGLYIIHDCGIQDCRNLNHLKVGTYLDTIVSLKDLRNNNIKKSNIIVLIDNTKGNTSNE